MKKILSVLFTIVMAFSLTACKAPPDPLFSASKNAYSYLNEAYELIDKFGSDIYDAWRMGIYDKDELKTGGLDYLANELYLSVDELEKGSVYFAFESKWDTISESDKEKYFAHAKNTYLTMCYSTDFNLMDINLGIVTSTYEYTGKTQEIEKFLDDAKTNLKYINEKNHNFEYYDSLKKYYTTLNSYYEYCQNPRGSFANSSSTIDDFRNEVNQCKSDLDFAFEE